MDVRMSGGAVRCGAVRCGGGCVPGEVAYDGEGEAAELVEAEEVVEREVQQLKHQARVPHVLKRVQQPYLPPRKRPPPAAAAATARRIGKSARVAAGRDASASKLSDAHRRACVGAARLILVKRVGAALVSATLMRGGLGPIDARRPGARPSGRAAAAGSASRMPRHQARAAGRGRAQEPHQLQCLHTRVSGGLRPEWYQTRCCADTPETLCRHGRGLRSDIPGHPSHTMLNKAIRMGEAIHHTPLSHPPSIQAVNPNPPRAVFPIPGPLPLTPHSTRPSL